MVTLVAYVYSGYKPWGVWMVLDVPPGLCHWHF